MKIFRLLATSLLAVLGMGVNSCNNEAKSSDSGDRVDENGKYIAYKEGDNNPFTGISIPTENPNMETFYESGVIVKKEQATNDDYKCVTTYDVDGIIRRDNTTYYDASGDVYTQEDSLKSLYNWNFKVHGYVFSFHSRIFYWRIYYSYYHVQFQGSILTI